MTHQRTPGTTPSIVWACLLAFVITLLLSACGPLLDGPSDVETAQREADSTQAAQEDAAAQASRDWAAAQVCGPNATAVWLGDKELQCLRHVDVAALKGSQP